MAMTTVVVLVALVSIATAGVVVPNNNHRAHSGYPAYNNRDSRYGGGGAYPDYSYGKPAAPSYPSRKDYVYPAPKPKTTFGYGNDYPYNNRYDSGFGSDYKKQPVYPAYPANNYDYKHRPVVPVVPGKKILDPYPNTYHSNSNDYNRGKSPYNSYQPIRPAKKVADPFPARTLITNRKPFDNFGPPSKSQIIPITKVSSDPYSYYGNQKNVYPAPPPSKSFYPAPGKSVFPGAPAKSVFPDAPSKSVFPTKRVSDPYYLSNPYQPKYGGQRVVDPYPAKAVDYPARKRPDPYSYSPKNLADPYQYPRKPSYPVRKVTDPYQYPSKSAYPVQKVADPYYYPSKSAAYPVQKVSNPYQYPSKSAYPVQKVADPYYNPINSNTYPVKKVADPYNYYPSRSAYPPKKIADPYSYPPPRRAAGGNPYYAGAAKATPVIKKEVAPPKSKSPFGSFPGFADLGKGFGKHVFPDFKF